MQQDTATRPDVEQHKINCAVWSKHNYGTQYTYIKYTFPLIFFLLLFTPTTLDLSIAASDQII